MADKDNSEENKQRLDDEFNRILEDDSFKNKDKIKDLFEEFFNSYDVIVLNDQTRKDITDGLNAIADGSLSPEEINKNIENIKISLNASIDINSGNDKSQKLGETNKLEQKEINLDENFAKLFSKMGKLSLDQDDHEMLIDIYKTYKAATKNDKKESANKILQNVKQANPVSKPDQLALKMDKIKEVVKANEVVIMHKSQKGDNSPDSERINYKNYSKINQKIIVKLEQAKGKLFNMEHNPNINFDQTIYTPYERNLLNLINKFNQNYKEFIASKNPTEANKFLINFENKLDKSMDNLLTKANKAYSKKYNINSQGDGVSKAKKIKSILKQFTKTNPDKNVSPKRSFRDTIKKNFRTP